MNFTKWLLIQEMASFSIPPGVDFEIPCNHTEPFGCRVGGIDMRFEDPPRTTDKNGKMLSQWSSFIGKIPKQNSWLIYSGGDPYLESNPQKIEQLKDSDYTLLPDDWWVKAEVLGKNTKPINYARGDIEGTRTAIGTTMDDNG